MNYENAKAAVSTVTNAVSNIDNSYNTISSINAISSIAVEKANIGGYMNIDNRGITMASYPTPKLIKQRGDKVIVFWMDDTHTVVVREQGSPDNLYLAFCAAFAKKMFGTTGKVIKAFNEADEREIKRKKEERLAEEEAKKAEAEKKLEEKKQAEFEKAVKQRMQEIKTELEALHRIEMEENKKRQAEREKAAQDPDQLMEE